MSDTLKQIPQRVQELEEQQNKMLAKDEAREARMTGYDIRLASVGKMDLGTLVKLGTLAATIATLVSGGVQLMVKNGSAGQAERVNALEKQNERQYQRIKDLELREIKRVEAGR